MNKSTFTTQNTIHTNRKQHCDEHHGNQNPMSLFFKQTHFGELQIELSVIFRDLRDCVILEKVAIEEPVEMLPSCGRMKRHVSICYILTSKVQQWQIATWVGFHPIGDIIHLTLNADPEIPWLIVCFELS